MNAGGAQATLKFRNGAATTSQGLSSISQGLGGRAPDSFSMKLLAVYLTEDIDPSTQSNRGMTSVIFLNPVCDADIMHCDVSGGTAEDGAPISHVVTDFFNFAADSEAVNAAINAQARSLEPATYRYARIEFCKLNQGNSENVKWAADGKPERAFKRNACTANSRVFDPPLVLEAGQSVTVTLGYSLSTLVMDTDPSGAPQPSDDCTAEGVCFSLPQFTPSATLVP